jgi:hypothetical protein
MIYAMFFLRLFKREIICTSIILLTGYTSMFSQGVWTIGYIPVDSLKNDFLGKEIRIDFKSSEVDILKDKINVRRLLSKKDTVSLKLNNQIVQFIENWNIYVDHGSITDQTLESVGGIGIKRMQIKEMFIEAINKTTLDIVVEIFFLEEKDISNPNKIRHEKHNIVVDKSLLKGILFRIQ